MILRDPDVESLSSFIGIDGSNTTLNAGRFLINLRPRAERNAVPVMDRRLQREVAGVPGIALYMQPVQDLSIDTTVSATQYQFVLETPILRVHRVGSKTAGQIKSIPSITDVASDMQTMTAWPRT